MISATRIHEIAYGHRVVGHEGKCRNLHGHNGLFELTLEAEELDSVGRVLDFSVIKNLLCQWLEDNWDHKMLLWNKDSFYGMIHRMTYTTSDNWGLVMLPCNPTAENLAMYFCEDIAPGLLLETNARLVEVKLWETSKCFVTYKVKDHNANPVGTFSRSTSEKTSDDSERIQTA